MIKFNVKFKVTEVDRKISTFIFDGQHQLDNSTFVFPVVLDPGKELTQQVMERFEGKGAVSDLEITIIEVLKYENKHTFEPPIKTE